MISRFSLSRLVVIACASLLSAAAHAEGNGTGVIQPGWNAYSDGNIFFYLSGPHTGSPCPTAERWAFDSTTAAGKSIYAAFLLAYASGKSVTAIGTGTCTHGNTETVQTLYVSN